MPSAVLLHPHPDMGGNQHNHVVSAVHDAFGAAGIAAHRFDFRSSDPQQAIDQTLEAIGAAPAPVVLVGYSFGGGIAAAVDHTAVSGWCLIAPALTLVAPAIAADPRPKLVLAAENDAWFGPDVLLAATAGWSAASHTVIAGADHFLAGPDADRAAILALRFAQQLAQWLPPPRRAAKRQARRAARRFT